MKPRGEAGVLSLRRASERNKGIRRLHVCFVAEEMEETQSGRPAVWAEKLCPLRSSSLPPPSGAEMLLQRQQGRA